MCHCLQLAQRKVLGAKHNPPTQISITNSSIVTQLACFPQRFSGHTSQELQTVHCMPLAVFTGTKEPVLHSKIVLAGVPK